MHTFPDAMKQPGLCADHLTRAFDILAASYACAETTKNHHKDRQEGRTYLTGGRERKREGVKEGGEEKDKGVAPETA